jgi:ubiquinone/menaquinone biosynthesis C-methylase UbiE
MPPDLPHPDQEIVAFYGRGMEHDRLRTGRGILEFRRTQEILRRLIPTPASVADIGGGTGAHAAWLARDGHRVTVVEPVAGLLDTAREVAAAQPEAPFDAMSGDARAVPLADGTQDAALLLGPLYHLQDRADRILALSEARRVVRPGGLVIGAAISRFATWMDGLGSELLLDDEYRTMAEKDLASGRHRAVEGRWFTTSYFHRPEDLPSEFAEAGLVVSEVVAVEGPAWCLPDVADRMRDPVRAGVALDVVRAIEHEPSLMGASQHFLAVGKRPL